MVKQIHLQAHYLPDDSKIQALKRTARKEKNLNLSDQAKSVNGLASPKIKHMVKLASEKGASSWLTVVPLSEMDFTLKKQEFRGLAIDWPFKDNPTRFKKKI